MMCSHISFTRTEIKLTFRMSVKYIAVDQSQGLDDMSDLCVITSQYTLIIHTLM